MTLLLLANALEERRHDERMAELTRGASPVVSQPDSAGGALAMAQRQRLVAALLREPYAF